ncbi:MAG: sulfatase-like hydrolase/transferase, partial [Saprospiraceae bacterium]|nr:sulfatase-like hydrolase/transferase [Saprospiraceae bacterium]
THALPLEEFTIAEAFSKNKYSTGFFGKWHLGYKQEHWAGNQGFDLALGGLTSKNAWKMLYPDRVPPVDQLETLMFSPHHLTHMEDGPENEYLTDRFADETIKFIREHRETPFFAYLSFHTVHTPLHAKPEVVEKYRKKIADLGILGKDEMNFGSRVHQNLPEYAAMVQHMDENVGRVLAEIDALGLRQNTIVVFTSDNGGKHSVTSNAPLRGAKHNLYEGGIRVPAIIRYPEKIPAQGKCESLLISDDFYPTLLDLSDLSLEKAQHLDGKSFKKLLSGTSGRSPHKYLCWHYPHRRFEGAVRWKDYKLIYEYKTAKIELYDLSSDLGERNNLADQQPRVARKMQKMLATWLEDTGARFPADGIILP